jgi:beta-galactosidase
MEPAGMTRAARWMLMTSGVKPDLPPVPDGVEVYRRAGNGKDIYIFENFRHASQTISLPHAMRNVLTGKVERAETLPVYGVAVLADAGRQ